MNIYKALNAVRENGSRGFSLEHAQEVLCHSNRKKNYQQVQADLYLASASGNLRIENCLQRALEPPKQI